MTQFHCGIRPARKLSAVMQVDAVWLYSTLAIHCTYPNIFVSRFSNETLGWKSCDIHSTDKPAASFRDTWLAAG